MAKLCPNCSILKSLNYFYRTIYSEDGRTDICKMCTDKKVQEKWEIICAQNHLRKILNRAKLSSSLTEDQIKEIGYDSNQLREYLNKQNMNWDEDHVDHKIPISWFIHETPPNIVNDLRNLQPLSSKENYTKNNKYCHPINKSYYDVVLEYILPQYKKELKIDSEIMEQI